MNCDDCGGACCKGILIWRVRASPKLRFELPLWLMRGFTIRELEGGVIECYSPPCINLDHPSGKCLCYAFRPEVCQQFEIGGEECKRMRKLWPANPS